MIKRNINQALAAGLEQANQNEKQHMDLDGTKSESHPKARSLSDAALPAPPPTPHIRDLEKLSCRDDCSLDIRHTASQKSNLMQRSLSLKMPSVEPKWSSELPHLSPNPEKYTTNMLPRRSRGMDFSRAATNLHHSTLADRSSPDSSPTTTSKIMNIPSRKIGYNMGSSGDSLHSHSPLWSKPGNKDQVNLSSSLGSINMIMGSDFSEIDSDQDDIMDDVDDTISTIPQVKANFDLNQDSTNDTWPKQPPSPRSPSKFRRSCKRIGERRKSLNSAGLSATPSSISKYLWGVPNLDIPKESEKMLDLKCSKSGSISWAANQLRISGNEADDVIPKHAFDNIDSPPITPSRDGQRGVIRRAVTRRGNMLPKSKGFARIQAALAEESAPVEMEVLREAEVIRQTRESEIDLEPRQNLVIVPCSPSLALNSHENSNSLGDDEKIPENYSTVKGIWETPGNNRKRLTSLPPAFPRTYDNSNGTDMQLDFHLNSNVPLATHESAGHQPSSTYRSATPQPGVGQVTVDITQKLSKKRFRDDDFDLCSLKRRAVSPGISAHNSPIIQSPMQRDHVMWGNRSSGACNTGEPGKSPINTFQKRVGLQGILDTNDSLMKMCIE